jgi:hypothetical protein
VIERVLLAQRKFVELILRHRNAIAAQQCRPEIFRRSAGLQLTRAFQIKPHRLEVVATD